MASPLSLFSSAFLSSPRRFDGRFSQRFYYEQRSPLMLAFYDVISRFYIATLRRSLSIGKESNRAFTGPPSRKRSYSAHWFVSIVILSDITQRGHNVKLIRFIRTNGQANDAHFLSIMAVTRQGYTHGNK